MKNSCQVNHSKSLGLTERLGTIEMFHRPIDKHKQRYTTYLGDVDSSSLSEGVDAVPYGRDILIEKYECWKSSTHKAINTLQSYYGMAICQTTGNLSAMRKVVGTVLYHCSDMKDEAA